MENIAVLAPMPSASVRMAATVNAGCFFNRRVAHAGGLKDIAERARSALRS